MRVMIIAADGLRAELLQAITETLADERDLLSTCRLIANGRYAAALQETEALDEVVAIESELDDIPSVEQKSQFAPEVYAQKQQEKDEYLALVGESLLESLERLRQELQADAP